MSEPSVLSGIGHLTDAGIARRAEPNQDSYALPSGIPPALLEKKGWLFIVADGMGTNIDKDRPSQLTVNLIQRAYYDDQSRQIPHSLTRAMQAANQMLYARSGVLFGEMSTAVVCVVVRGRTLHVAHAGDCRAYRVGREDCQALTADHVVESEAGDDVTSEQVPAGPARKLLTRSVGSMPTVVLDYKAFTVNEEDRILLCTKGLTNVVGDCDLQTIVSQHSPEEAVKQLVALAVERGGPENITAVVIEPAALVAVVTPAASRPKGFALARVAWLPQAAATVIPAASSLKPSGLSWLGLAVAGTALSLVALLALIAGNMLSVRSAPSAARSPATSRAVQNQVTPSPVAPEQLALVVAPTGTPTAIPPTPTASPSPTPHPTDTPQASVLVTTMTVVPTSTRRPSATATLSPPTPTLVAVRYPAVKLREPKNDQTVTGNSVTFEWEESTLQPGDRYAVLYRRTTSSGWEGTCLPVQTGRCVLFFGPGHTHGGYTWNVVIFDEAGNVVNQAGPSRQFYWVPPAHSPTPGCTPTPTKPC